MANQDEQIDFSNVEDIRRILGAIRLGLWSMEVDDDAPPRLYADPTMRELLGLAPDADMSPEEVYRHWYDRINPDHLPEANEALVRMADWQRAEAQYPWNHPELGTVIVRCGGWRSRTYTHGIRYEGGHQLVTNVFHVEKSNGEKANARGKFETAASFMTTDAYAFCVIASLSTGDMECFVGTGVEALSSAVKSAKDYRGAVEAIMNVAPPACRDKLRALISIDYLRNCRKDAGLVGRLECEVQVDGIAAWLDVCAYISKSDDRTSRVYLLSRDITASRLAASENVGSLEASMTRERVLDAAMKTVFGFSMAVDLTTGKFRIRRGRGMDDLLSAFQTDHHYSESVDRALQFVDASCREKARKLLGFDFLVNTPDRDGVVGSVTFRMTMGGAFRWHEVSVYRARENDVPVAFIFVHDVTAVHAMAEQRDREQRFESTQNALLADITKQIFGYNITVDLATMRYTIIVGTGSEMVIGPLSKTDDYKQAFEMRFGQLMSDDDRGVMMATTAPDVFRAAAKAGIRGFHKCFDYRINVQGIVRWEETRVFFGVDSDERPVANLLCRDVTDIHIAEERREREHKYEESQNALLAGITKELFGYNLTVDLTTFHYTMIVGSGLEKSVEFLRKHDNALIALSRKVERLSEEDRRMMTETLSLESLRDIALSGRHGFYKRLEYRVYDNGRVGWEEMSVFLAVDSLGKPIANVLVRDVTSMHAVIDAELEAERRAAEAKSLFFSTVSHDIRTPLNAIIGYAELLKIGMSDDKEREQALDAIVSSGNVLMALVNDVLDLSKLEAGRLEIRPEPFDVAQIIRETAAAFSLACERKGIEIRQDVGSFGLLNVDPQRIRQLLLNLVGNAVKFTERGAVTVHADYASNGMLSLSVSDTGCGIPEEDQRNLLEPFMQAKTVGSQAGTGLGLAICKRLVERMNGRISFTSKVGEGSVFTIELPVTPATIKADAPADTASGPLSAAVQHAGGTRVLIVDDSPVNLTVLTALLRRIGITDIVKAANGALALEQLDEREFDIVLTDLWMPVLNGEGLVAEIRRNPKLKDLPVYAVTADVEAQRVDRDKGFTGVLLKPLTLAALSKIIS